MKALEFLKGRGPEDVRLALISGAEEYLRSRVIEKVLAGIGAEADVIEGPAAREAARFDLAGLLDSLRTPSLFGGETVFVLRQADALIKEHGEVVIRFLKDEFPGRLIIEGAALVAKPGKAAAKKESLAAVVEARGGLVVTCDPLYDTPFGGRGSPWQTELCRFIVDEARARGKALAAEDAYELHQLVGTGLRELVGEIDKLVTFVGDRKRIEARDIDAAVGAVRTSVAFRLAEAVASCDLKEALRTSADLFERGAADPSGGRRLTDVGGVTMLLIGATAQKLRRIGAVLSALDLGASLDEALAASPTHPAFRRQFEEQVMAWRKRSLARATEALLGLEKDLKSAGGPPRALVDRFLVAALGREPARRGRTA